MKTIGPVGKLILVEKQKNAWSDQRAEAIIGDLLRAEV